MDIETTRRVIDRLQFGLNFKGTNMLDKTATLATPNDYDEAERWAMLSLPNRVIEASRAVAFQAVGYPTRVNDVRELWRYADVMQEGRIKPTFDAIGGLTEHEFELVQQVTRDVEVLTLERCGHRVVPGAALIRAVPVYRAIEALHTLGCDVFELGAGSGYVGALLQADERHGADFDYKTSDVAQAFALWQMHLLGTEAVIPWWDWMTKGGPQVDVFTANHMLNELHPNALVYMAKQARKMLGDNGVFLVENYGSTVVRRDDETIRVLEQHGIKPINVTSGHDTPNRVVQWPRMVDWWHSEFGGIPKSDDEQYLESLT